MLHLIPTQQHPTNIKNHTRKQQLQGAQDRKHLLKEEAQIPTLPPAAPEERQPKSYRD